MNKICETNIVLAVVIPCYNEEEVLQETYNVLSSKMQQLIDSKDISQKSFLCFVDDGSKDNTWNILKRLNTESKTFTPPPM